MARAYFFHPEVARAGDTGWSTWSGSDAGLRYSGAVQITPENVRYLEEAWHYHTGDLDRYHEEDRAVASFQATPILVPLEDDPILAFCTGSDSIIAIDAVTGTRRWQVDPEFNPDSTGTFACRGVAWWRDETLPAGAACRDRVISGTQELHVLAIDAASGEPCEDFGDRGIVRVEPGKPLFVAGEVGFKSPPAVAEDLVILGSAIRDMARVDTPGPEIRAFDARTGELRWSFNPLATDPANPDSATWPPGSHGKRGGANAWGAISYDAALGMVYVPTSAPSVDIYGGDRAGDNLYANSVIALDAKTGERVWHFQTVHHDLWDYDLAAQPVLVDLEVNGRTRHAVVQPTKMGLTFVLDRATGEPIHPVEERPAPQSAVPGERTSPTQPFPTVVPPLGPMTLSEDDMWGPLGIGRASCIELLNSIDSRGPYTPPSEQGSLSMPMPFGGINWGGISVDPRSGIMVANPPRMGSISLLIEREGEPTPLGDEKDISTDMDIIIRPQNGVPYEAGAKMFVSTYKLPCNAPPWGVLTAINLATGEVRWEQPFGTTAAQTLIPFNIGLPSHGGGLTTGSGLFFIGASMDERFRAYDVATGEELWRVKLPAGGQASPMTYVVDGRQYVVIAAGGHFVMMTRTGDSVIAYALPDRFLEAAR